MDRGERAAATLLSQSDVHVSAEDQVRLEASNENDAPTSEVVTAGNLYASISKCVLSKYLVSTSPDKRFAVVVQQKQINVIQLSESGNMVEKSAEAYVEDDHTLLLEHRPFCWSETGNFFYFLSLDERGSTRIVGFDCSCTCVLGPAMISSEYYRENEDGPIVSILFHRATGPHKTRCHVEFFMFSMNGKVVRYPVDPGNNHPVLASTTPPLVSTAMKDQGLKVSAAGKSSRLIFVAGMETRQAGQAPNNTNNFVMSAWKALPGALRQVAISTIKTNSTESEFGELFFSVAKSETGAGKTFSKKNHALRKEHGFCGKVVAAVRQLLGWVAEDRLVFQDAKHLTHSLSIVPESDGSEALQVASLDFCGTVNMWTFQDENFVSQNVSYSTNDVSTYATSIAWWESGKLFLTYRSGNVAVVDRQSAENTLWEPTNISSTSLCLRRVEEGNLFASVERPGANSLSFINFQRIEKAQLLNMYVSQGKFNKATEIAEHFNLSMDVVRKGRWDSCDTATAADVHETLNKIEDRPWVLQKCLAYNEANVDVIEMLLDLGVKLTACPDISADLARILGQKPNSQGKAFTGEDNEEERELPSDDESVGGGDESSGDDEDGWSDDDWSVDEEDETSESSKEESETRAITPISQNETIMSAVLDEIGNVIAPHRETISMRVQFLKYKCRLESYKWLLGHFQSQHSDRIMLSWLNYRDCCLTNYCKVLASNGAFDAIAGIFAIARTEVLHARLDILNHIPDTVPVDSYGWLLPHPCLSSGIKTPRYVYMDRASGKIETMDFHHAVYKSIMCDWSFDPHILRAVLENRKHEKVVSWASSIASSCEDSNIRALMQANTVVKWYVSRAYRMETCSGQLSNALALSTLGLTIVDKVALDSEEITQQAYLDLVQGRLSFQCIKGNVGRPCPVLLRLSVALSSLERLVYGFGGNGFSFSGLSLESWLELSKTNKLDLVLRGANSENVVYRIRKLLVPLMGARPDDDVSVTEKEWCNEIVDFMIQAAKREDGFLLCEAIFKACDLRNAPRDAIIRQPPMLIRTALACIYACPSVNLVNAMTGIFNMIPVINETHRTEFTGIEELDRRVDKLDVHLNAVEVLRTYGISPLISFFDEFEDSISHENMEADDSTYNQGRLLIENVCRKFLAEGQQGKDLKINRLMEDLRYIRVALPSIPLSFCHQMVLKHLVGNCHFKVASSMLSRDSFTDGTGGQTLTHESIEQILLDISIEFFNSASGAQDPALGHAKQTLNMAPKLGDKIMAELHLIEASMLITNLGSSLLPLQLRLMNNRSDVIARVLKDNPSIYADAASVRKLCVLLNINDALDGNAQIQLMLLNGAIQAGDFPEAARLILSLLDVKCSAKTQHDICKKTLLFLQDKRWANHSSKQKIMKKLIASCPGSELQTVLRTWKALVPNSSPPKKADNLSLYDLHKPYQFAKFWKHAKAGDRNPPPAVTSSLDSIDSDDRYPFQLSLALSLSKVNGFPEEVQKYYSGLANPDNKGSNKRILALACSVFCIEAILASSKKDRSHGKVFFYCVHMSFSQLLDKVKNVNLGEIPPPNLSHFKACKSIANNFAGDAIRKRGRVSDTVGQYLLTHEFLKDLSPEQVVKFVQSLVSPEGNDDLQPLGVRCATVDDALRLLLPDSTEYEKVKRWRCMLSAVEELEASVAMNDYPLLSSNLSEIAFELERISDFANIENYFTKMASKGVPPLLLSRVLGSFSGEFHPSTRENGGGLPSVLAFYRKGLQLNLSGVRKVAEGQSPDQNDILYDLYVSLLHIRDDPNKAVLEMTTETLLDYYTSLDKKHVEKAFLLECFESSAIFSDKQFVRQEASSLFNAHLVVLPSRARIFIASLLCREYGAIKIGYKLLEYHFVHEALRNNHSANEIASKYVNIYSKEKSLKKMHAL